MGSTLYQGYKDEYARASALKDLMVQREEDDMFKDNMNRMQE